MYVKHLKSLKFMFLVNKETRAFLKNNMMTIRNGFMNEGLIELKFKNDYNFYLDLEKLYFQILERNINNRKLTIDASNFIFYNNVTL